MIDHTAVGILAARSRARILALILNTSFNGWTIRIMYTFRSATLIGISDIIRKAGASARIALHPAKGISSAGGW